jgi:HAD superfamily hydrolase (TIGR01549 family)
MFYKGIIFDLDNTIYDYNYCHNIALESVFTIINKKFNIDIKLLNDSYNKISSFLKFDLNNTASSHNKFIYFKKLFEKFNLNLDLLNITNQTYWDTFLNNMKCYDHLIEFIKWNKNLNIKIGILTDYQLEYQIIKLKQLNLTKYIDVILTSEEIGIEKPSNYPFLSILNKMNLKYHQVIMIGDNYEKDINGANNLNIKSYQFIKNTNFYQLLLNDFININEELIKLKKISIYTGERFDLTQAGGGNTSVKINTSINNKLLIIKSSGINLSMVSEDSGYTIINNDKLYTDILDNKLSNKLSNNITDYNYFGNNRGSIETYMHSFLKKYTIHLHPIQINKILITKNARDIIKNICNSALIIDYYTPGIKLANIIKDNYNNENIIFLINHGVIFTTDNYDDIFNLIETTLNKFEKYLKLDFSIYKNTNNITKTINNLFNTISVSYLSQNSIIHKYLLNKSSIFYNQKLDIAFPDCLIYCGLYIYHINNIDNHIDNNIFDYKPNIIILNNQVYINSSSLQKCREIEEVLVANLLILDSEYDKNYLSNDEINYLNNWESEIFRKNI